MIWLSISILQFTRPSYQQGAQNPFVFGAVSQGGLPQQINSNRHHFMPGMQVMHGRPVPGYLIILFVESWLFLINKMFKFFNVGTAPLMPWQNNPWWLLLQRNKKEKGENFFRIRYVNVVMSLEKVGKIINNWFSECIMNVCHSSLLSRID